MCVGGRCRNFGNVLPVSLILLLVDDWNENVLMFLLNFSVTSWTSIALQVSYYASLVTILAQGYLHLG